MKKLLFILSLIIFITGCDSDQNTSPQPEPIITVQDSIQEYTGNFISAGDAAVLKGSRFIYQVQMDSTAKALKDSLNYYKDQNGGIIPVTVKGKVVENKSSTGYSQAIKIREVVEIAGEKEDNIEVQN